MLRAALVAALFASTPAGSARPAHVAALLEVPTPEGHESLLAPALKLVEDRYVDPPRAKPENMLESAVASLATAVPGLESRRLENGALRVRFGRRTAELSVAELIDLSELASALDRVVDLVTRDAEVPRSRAGVELALLDGALAGLDARSRVLLPEEVEWRRADAAGRTGGIAVDLTMKDGVLRIVTPVTGGPAAKAGLRSGDRILHIDGAPVADGTIEDAIRRLRGPLESKVEVTVTRDGWKRPATYTLVRGTIEAKPIESRRLEDGVGYLRFLVLSDAAAAELPQHLARLPERRKALRGLVLDLRGCAGGTVDAAVALADRFLAGGDIVSVASRHDKHTRSAGPSGEDLTDVPLAVLVDRETGLPGEIAAAALQGADRALVAGEPTRGRAGLMSVLPLPAGAALELATSQYLTTGGRRLEGTGVTPDVREVSEDRDPGIEVARRLLVRAGNRRRSAMLGAAGR